MNSSPLSSRQAAEKQKSLYFLTWRWHFYAGLFVVPFMLMLSLTGLVMLLDDEIERFRYSAELVIEPKTEMVPVSQQLQAVQAAYPDAVVTQYIPSKAENIAHRFSITLIPSQNQVFVTVNQYNAEVLGVIDRNESIYNIANGIHSTLLIGDLGDLLIEISASLGILLLITGVYLWLPRDKASKAGFLKIRRHAGTRTVMRDVHANAAGILSLVLLFFFISGLSWTGVWGAKLVQAWNTFPTYYVWGQKPQSTLEEPLTHKELNHGNEEELPWNLELASLPQSDIPPETKTEPEVHDHSKMNHAAMDVSTHSSISIDEIVEQAEALGFAQFRVFYPRSETGVFTLTANSMAGDVSDPRDDLTVHIDQYSGEVLMKVSWEDYAAVAKLLAASVSVHQGDAGLVNKLLNILFCLAFVVISTLGIVMWWKRQPSQGRTLGAPPKFKQDGVWKTGAVALIITCVLFPMAGAVILTVLLLDWLVLRRIRRAA